VFSEAVYQFCHGHNATYMGLLKSQIETRYYWAEPYG